MARRKNSYVANIGKSVKFSMKETLESRNPAISGFMTQNQEFFQNIRDTLKQLRQGQSRIADLFKLDDEDRETLELAKKGIDKTFERIKTGDFSTVSEEDEMKAMGLDMSDMDFGDDGEIGLDDSLDDMKDLMAEIKADTGNVTPLEKTTATVGEAQVAAAQATTKAVVQVGQANANAISTLDKHMQSNNEILMKGFSSNNKLQASIAFNRTKLEQALHAQSLSALNTVNENLVNIVDFNNNILGKFTNDTMQYYTDSLAELRKITSVLERAYPDLEKEKEANRRESVYDKLRLGSDSVLDLGGYTKQIKENFLNTGAGSMLSMIFNPMVMGQFANKGFTGLAFDALIDSMISPALKKSMDMLNKNIKSFVPAMLGKFARVGEESQNPLFSFLGEVFGIRPGATEKDMSKYNKKAIPFDGMTKHAITFVIPNYLSQIVELLGGERNVFRYDTGKFEHLQNVKKQVEEDRESDARTAVDYDVAGELHELIKHIELKEGEDAEKTRRGYREGFDEIIRRIAKSGKSFVNIHNADELSQLMGDSKLMLENPEMIDVFAKLASLLSNKAQMQLASAAHRYSANRMNRFAYQNEFDLSYEYANSKLGTRARLPKRTDEQELKEPESITFDDYRTGKWKEKMKAIDEYKKWQRKKEEEARKEEEAELSESSSSNSILSRFGSAGTDALVTRADSMIEILRSINTDAATMVSLWGGTPSNQINPNIPPAPSNQKKKKKGGTRFKNKTKFNRRVKSGGKTKSEEELKKEEELKRKFGMSDDEFNSYQELVDNDLTINLEELGDFANNEEFKKDFKLRMKEYNEEKRAEKEEENRDKETFFDRLTRILRSPMDAVANALDSVGNVMHDLLFGDEDNRGMIEHIRDTLKEGFKGVTDTIKKEFWDPFKRMIYSDFVQGGIGKWVKEKVEAISNSMPWNQEEEELESEVTKERKEKKTPEEEAFDKAMKDLTNPPHSANGRPGFWMAPHYAKGRNGKMLVNGKWVNAKGSEFKRSKVPATGYYKDANGNWVVMNNGETEIVPSHHDKLGQANDKKNENNVVLQLYSKAIQSGNKEVVNMLSQISKTSKEELDAQLEQLKVSKEQVAEEKKASQAGQKKEKIKGIKGYAKTYFGYVIDNISEHIFGKNVDENGKQKPIMDQIGDMFAKGARNFSNYFFGGDYGDKERTVDEYKTAMKKALPSGIGRGIVIGGGLALASATSGFGVLGSLLLPGGPIASIIVGMGAGLALENRRFREWLFGKEDESGKYKNGKLSGLANFVKENKATLFGGAAIGVVNAVTGGGLIGGLMGMLPFGVGALPMMGISILGPVTVAMGASLAYKSERMQNLLFGKMDEKTGKKTVGLMEREGIKSVRQKLPNIAMGAGLGAAGALVLGSGMGIMPIAALGIWKSAIIGGAIGFGLSSKKFREAMFGVQDENGEFKKGGLVDRIQNLLTHEIVNPFRQFFGKEIMETKNWFLKSVFLPLKKVVPIYKTYVGMMFRRATAGLKKVFDSLGERIEKTLGPIGKFLRKAVVSMVDGVRKSVGGTLHTMLSFARGLLLAPIKLLQLPTGMMRKSIEKHGTEEEKAKLAEADVKYDDEKKRIEQEVKDNRIKWEGDNAVYEAERKLARANGYEATEEQLREKTRQWKERQALLNSISDKIDKIIENTGKTAEAAAGVETPHAAIAVNNQLPAGIAKRNIKSIGKLRAGIKGKGILDPDAIPESVKRIRTATEKKKVEGQAAEEALDTATKGESANDVEIKQGTTEDPDKIDRNASKNRWDWILKQRSEEEYRGKILSALQNLKEKGGKAVEKTSDLLSKLFDFLKGAAGLAGILALLKSLFDFITGKGTEHDERVIRDAAQIAARKAARAVGRRLEKAIAQTAIGKRLAQFAGMEGEKMAKDAAEAGAEKAEKDAAKKGLRQRLADKGRAAKDWVKKRWQDAATAGGNVKRLGMAVGSVAKDGVSAIGKAVGNSAPVRFMDDLRLGLKYGPQDRIITDEAGRTHHMRYDRKKGWQEVTGLAGSEFRDMNWMREQEKLAGRSSIGQRLASGAKTVAKGVGKAVGYTLASPVAVPYGMYKLGQKGVAKAKQGIGEFVEHNRYADNAAGKAIGMIDSLSKMPGKFVDTVSSGASSVTNWAKELPGKIAKDPTISHYADEAAKWGKSTALYEVVHDMPAMARDAKEAVGEMAGKAKMIAKEDMKAVAETKVGKAVVGSFEWFMEKARGAVDAVCDNSTVKKYLGAGAGKLKNALGGQIGKVTKDLFKNIAKKVAKASIKTAAMVGSVGIAQLAFSCYDAYSGYNDASELWGVNPEDVTPGMRTASVILNVIMGLGPMVWVDLALEAVYLGSSMLNPSNPINIKRQILQMIYSALPDVTEEDTKAVEALQNKANEEYEKYVMDEYLKAKGLSEEDLANMSEEDKAKLEADKAEWLKTADVKSKDEMLHEKNENYNPVMDAVRKNPVGGWLFGYKDENGKFHKGIFSRMKDGIFGTGEKDANGNVDEGLWGKAKNLIGRFAGMVGKFFQGAYDFFSGAYDFIFNKNTDEKLAFLWKLIIGGENDEGQYELGIIPKAYGAIRDTFTSIKDGFLEFGSKYLDCLVHFDIKGCWRLIGSIFDSWFGTNFLGEKEEDGIISNATKSIGEFWGVIYDKFESGKKWFGDLFDKVIHADFKGMKQMIWGLFDVPADDGIGGLIKKATDIIGKFFKSVKEKFDEVYDWWDKFSLIDSIKNYLKEEFPMLSKAIGDTKTHAYVTRSEVGMGGGYRPSMINITPGGGSRFVPMPAGGYNQKAFSGTKLAGDRRFGTYDQLGCGPTGVATAMTAAGIPIDPRQAGSVLTAADMAPNGSGVLPSGIAHMVNAAGGSFTPIDPRNKRAIQFAMDNGASIITGGSRADGISTRAGHYNVIVGNRTHDPLGRASRRVTADDISRTASGNGLGMVGIVEGYGGQTLHRAMLRNAMLGGAGNALKMGAQQGYDCTLHSASALWNAYTGDSTTSNSFSFGDWYGRIKGMPSTEYGYSKSERSGFETTVANHFNAHPDYPIYLYQTGGDGHGAHPINRGSGNHATIIGRKLSDGKYQIFDSNGGVTHQLELNQIFDPTAKGSSKNGTNANEANLLLIPNKAPSSPITEWVATNGSFNGTTASGSEAASSPGASAAKSSSNSNNPYSDFFSKIGKISQDFAWSMLAGTTYKGTDFGSSAGSSSSGGDMSPGNVTHKADGKPHYNFDVSKLPKGQLAMAVSANTGLPADLILSQWGQECGRDFSSNLARNYHNYGGMKAGDAGTRSKNGFTWTITGRDGRGHSYFKDDQSFVDYSSYYYPLYAEDGIMSAQTPAQWVRALKHGGYFTADENTYRRNVEDIWNYYKSKAGGGGGMYGLWGGGGIDSSAALDPGAPKSLPFFKQWDSRWGSKRYGFSNGTPGNSYAASACGPTSMAMVSSWATGNVVSPEEVAKVATSMPGMHVTGGTANAFFDAYAKTKGFGMTQTNDKNAVMQSLAKGVPVVNLQSKGEFTEHGHFIVLAGKRPDGSIIVYDPNRRSPSEGFNERQVFNTTVANWIPNGSNLGTGSALPGASSAGANSPLSGYLTKVMGIMKDFSSAVMSGQTYKYNGPDASASTDAKKPEAKPAATTTPAAKVPTVNDAPKKEGGSGLRSYHPYKYAAYGNGESNAKVYQLRPNSQYAPSSAGYFIHSSTMDSNMALVEAIHALDVHPELRQLIDLMSVQVKNQTTINTNLINTVKAVGSNSGGKGSSGGASGAGAKGGAAVDATKLAQQMKKTESPQSKPDGPDQQSKKGISGTNNYQQIHAKNLEIAKGGKFAV